MILFLFGISSKKLRWTSPPPTAHFRSLKTLYTPCIGMVQIKCLNVSLHIWIRFQEMSKIALMNIWTAYFFSYQMKSRNDTCTFLLSSRQSWYVVLVILVLCRFSFVYRIHQCISDNSFTNCLPNQIILTFWKTASNKVQLFWEGHKNLRDRPYGFDVY